MLEDVTCPGGTAEVAAAWVTQNASAVNFSVDGQPLPAAAGFRPPAPATSRFPATATTTR
jgi:hypothetical protein